MARIVAADSEVTTAAEASDGRVRRGVRNRERILDALFELVGEGALAPTAERVAQRAGVGTRTVFRHFEDMESLFAAMSERLHDAIKPLLEVEYEAGGVAERARGLVRRRAPLFDRTAPYTHAAGLHRWHSPYLQAQQVHTVRLLRADLLRTLPELGEASAPILDAAEQVTSFEAWDRLRNAQQLGRERAEAAVVAGLLALLGTETE